MNVRKKISRENVKSKILGQGNKIMSGTFAKKDGSIRQMNFRLGVHFGKEVGPGTAEKDENSYVTVYDMNTDGYRNINLKTMKTMSIEGEKYRVV